VTPEAVRGLYPAVLGRGGAGRRPGGPGRQPEPAAAGHGAGRPSASGAPVPGLQLLGAGDQPGGGIAVLAPVADRPRQRQLPGQASGCSEISRRTSGSCLSVASPSRISPPEGRRKPSPGPRRNRSGGQSGNSRRNHPTSSPTVDGVNWAGG